ncbi:MAG: 30S ribosomal protein S12 methylthiotransferase RimO [Lachnospiraceae bacterium]|nr:30S ribosomal protein S12 methylthiotransferase RimO [Lachnospiraceae bacterium]
MKIFFVSLGCDKNLVDSEMMIGMLAERGHIITDDEKEAEVVVVNTCCFILDAKQESIDTILQMAELKKTGNMKALLVTGCLGERYREEIQKEIPQVDAILGTNSFDKIADAIDEVIQGKQKNYFHDIQDVPVYGKKRMVTTGGHYAYLKIAEGCDKHCTYCIIPKIRGNYRSVPMEVLVGEAQKLADDGVKELILVAQETTVYGKDIYGKKELPELLRRLAAIDGICMIRLLYCYPEEITPELISVMKQEEKICHYLDMPIQHADDNILKRMGRRTDREQLRSTIMTLRREIPDICLRTTLITGFPGETKKEFCVLKEFVNEMRFDRLGVFPYSPEEGTAAAGMKKQVPSFVKNHRRNSIMKLQQKIAFEKAKEMTGRSVKVLIEGKLPKEGVFIGRTYMDAPNVDGMIFINSNRELITGDIISAVITGSHEYDLIGEEVS